MDNSRPGYDKQTCKKEQIESKPQHKVKSKDIK